MYDVIIIAGIHVNKTAKFHLLSSWYKANAVGITIHIDMNSNTVIILFMYFIVFKF